MIYSIVPAHEIKEYLQANEQRHWRDVKDKSVYNDTSVNYEMYEELSKEGLCWAVIAKDNNDIVGYNVYTITTDLNKNDEIIAMDVALFIEKKYRGRLIIDFIKECDKLLKEIDVKRVIRSFCDDRIGRILERADYKPRSRTYSKVL